MKGKIREIFLRRGNMKIISCLSHSIQKKEWIQRKPVVILHVIYWVCIRGVNGKRYILMLRSLSYIAQFRNIFHCNRKGNRLVKIFGFNYRDVIKISIKGLHNTLLLFSLSSFYFFFLFLSLFLFRTRYPCKVLFNGNRALKVIKGHATFLKYVTKNVERLFSESKATYRFHLTSTSSASKGHR